MYHWIFCSHSFKLSNKMRDGSYYLNFFKNRCKSLDEVMIYFVHCHLCSDFFTFLYFGISFSSHSLHCFLTLFLDVLDLSSSILKFSFFPFNKLGEEMQYITIYAVHTYNNRKCHRDNAKLKDG